VNQRQCYLPLFQIVADALAKLFFGGNVIKKIIHQLKRYAEIHAKISQCLLLALRCSTQNRPRFAGGRHQNGRFRANDVYILLFRQIKLTRT